MKANPQFNDDSVQRSGAAGHTHEPHACLVPAISDRSSHVQTNNAYLSRATSNSAAYVAASYGDSVLQMHVVAQAACRWFPLSVQMRLVFLRHPFVRLFRFDTGLAILNGRQRGRSWAQHDLIN